jgi:hypothetical protein
MKSGAGAMRVLGARLILALGVALLLGLPCGGQQGSSDGSSISRHLQMQVGDPEEGLRGDMRNPLLEEKRLRLLSIAQHKAMVEDTGKLVKLVSELNAEISSTNPSALTAEQLRKVAEIEKLARSVRDKMRISLKSAPVFLDSMPTAPLSRR